VYATVAPEINNLLHTKLKPTSTDVIADQFFAELGKEHDVDDAIFLVDDVVPLH
jgi:transposase-like protein